MYKSNNWRPHNIDFLLSIGGMENMLIIKIENTAILRSINAHSFA